MARADLVDSFRYVRRLLRRHKQGPLRRPTTLTWENLMDLPGLAKMEVRGPADGPASGGRIYVDGRVYEVGIPYRKRVRWNLAWRTE